MTAVDDAKRSGFAGWWDSLGRGQQALVLVVGAIVVVNVVVSGLGSIVGGGNPGGPAASAFSTGSDGLEGYADLLARNDHHVTRRREGLGERPLPAAATVVVADPGKLRDADLAALGQFVSGGGRLVLAGHRTQPALQALTGSDVAWASDSDRGDLAVWTPSADVGSAATLAGDHGGRWTDPGPLLPLAGADGRPAIVAGPVGHGHVVALADASLLDNEHLARADNAALGLALAGRAGSPVVFVESVHGFGASGLDALPASWRWAGAGLVVATLIGLWAAGARFGPAEHAARQLRPPRLEHVQAIAADLDQVTSPPRDLEAALRDGAAAARRERAARHIPDPEPRPTTTVAATTSSGGDPL